MPTLFGLTAKYGTTPYTLWREKTGKTKPWGGNEKTDWGTKLEPLILARYIEGIHGKEEYEDFLEILIKFKASEILIPYVLKGETVGPTQACEFLKYEKYMVRTAATNDDYPFLSAHADLWIPEWNRIQEAKSSSFFGSLRHNDPDGGYSRDNLTSNGVPLSVYIQVQHQMLCYGAKTAGVSALLDTSTYLEYGPWKNDEKLQAKIIEIADRFQWHVVNDKPPEPTTWEDYEDLFPNVTPTACVFPLEYPINEDLTIQDMLETYINIDSEIKKKESKLKDLKKAIGILMGENQTLQTPDGEILATMVKAEKSTVKGVKELEKTCPEILEKLRQLNMISESKYKYPKIKYKGLE
jgi:predicted phage-related endonuclease